MPYQEIKDLLDKQEYLEALQIAREEYKANAGLWEARNLFRCLYHNAKAAAKDNDPELASEFLEQMQLLYKSHDLNDEINNGMLERTRRLSNPTGILVQQAYAQAKAGNGEGAYATVSSIYNDGRLPDDQTNAYGWIIYYSLKQQSDNDVERLVVERKRRLMRYIELGLPSPSLLHSLILSEAVRIERTTPLKFVLHNFFDLWGGSDKLRPEDWEQFEGEHGTLPSLVEKLVTVYVKEVMTDGRDPSEDFVTLIDKALETFGNNQNLPRQRAQIYLHFNQKDKAIDLYRKQLKRNASRYYLWAELAALVEDADTRLALTCMALSIKTKEDFLGKIRIYLAEQLCDRNEYALAAGQLALVRRCYERQGWHIPPTIAKVSDRIPAETAEADGRDFIRRHADEANIYLYDNAIHTTLVKSGETTDRKTQKRRWWAADADGNRYSLDPRRLHLPGKCPDGTAIKAVIADKRVLQASVSDTIPTFVQEFSGTVKRRVGATGKAYTFIDKAYVGQNLLDSDIIDGSTISVLAIRGKDDKWTALRIVSPSHGQV